MSLRVATALRDTDFEDRLALRLAQEDAGAVLVRRCLDLIELRSVAAAHLVDVVVVDPAMRGIDRDVVSLLHSAGVRVVAVTPGSFGRSAHDAPSIERVARALGVDAVVSADGDAVCRALRGGVSSSGSRAVGDAAGPSGKVVAVWGPLGSPGRTTVATAVADEMSRSGRATLLVDADSYGASIAQQVGLLDDASGLAASCRLASAGHLDVAGLQRCTVALPSGLRVLTGIAKPDRWDELRPASLEGVWEAARGGYAATVVDIGFCVEHDEVAWADGIQPQRNQASIATLRTADTVIAVAEATPVGIVRFIRDLPTVRSLAATAEIYVAANRVPKRDEAAIISLLKEQLGVETVRCLPTDTAVVEAWRSGLTLSEGSRRSSFRSAVDDLVREIAGEPLTRRRRKTA